MNSSSKDKALGLDRPIARRDFLNGAAIALGAIGGGKLGIGKVSAETGLAWPQDEVGYYPPGLTGLRGGHPGSFEAAHALRDGDFWKDRGSGGPQDSGEHYDLIIVGAGISGLAAADFYRAVRPKARILILDNHDDFGGHAKRNEFRLAGRLHLINGGTDEIDSPRPYGAVADGLLRSLGVDPEALAKACEQQEVYVPSGSRAASFKAAAQTTSSTGKPLARIGWCWMRHREGPPTRRRGGLSGPHAAVRGCPTRHTAH